MRPLTPAAAQRVAHPARVREGVARAGRRLGRRRRGRRGRRLGRRRDRHRRGELGVGALLADDAGEPAEDDDGDEEEGGKRAAHSP